MPQRSDEAEWWFNAVYEAVQEIPYGHVTSYGHIARLLGKRTIGWELTSATAQCPRQVGICLKHLPTFTPSGSSTSTSTSTTTTTTEQEQHYFHNENVPWQRVVNAKGVISPRGPGAAARQAAALRREGVMVDTGSLGELTVDLARFGWFPDILPSEEAEMGGGGDSEG